MRRTSSILEFRADYKVPRGLQLQLLLEMKPGRLVGGGGWTSWWWWSRAVLPFCYSDMNYRNYRILGVSFLLIAKK